MAQKRKVLLTSVTITSSSLLCRVVSSVDFPNPDNYNDLVPPGATPKSTVRVITPDQ